MVDFLNVEKGIIIISRFSEMEYYFKDVVKINKNYYVVVQPVNAENVYNVSIDVATQIFKIKEEK